MAPMTKDMSFHDGLLGEIPSLRAFARSITGNPDRADDLVQETLVKAWANRGRYEPGTNLRAWLFTILRNTFYSEFRKRTREVSDTEGRFAASLAQQASQLAHLDLEEFKRAFSNLPEDQREALFLIGASGFSYEEAAAICGCAVGTMKSRTNRARQKLAHMLEVRSPDDFGPDAVDAAALSVSRRREARG
jgi:RNA polymerase sigma-70 factor (ECF subfamily)